jgi:hypothetical protein
MVQFTGVTKALGMVGSAVAIGTGWVFTSPVAAAQPDMTGKTYGEASGELSSAGYTAVVGTVVGSQVPLDECFVVGATAPTFIDAMGSSSSDGEIRLNLSCYPEPASETKAGFSAGNSTPAAQAVRDATEKKQAESETGVPSEDAG